MRTFLLLAATLVLFGPTVAFSQVTPVHGNTLSDLINNLYGADGIQLKPNQHEAHFGDTLDFQQFSETLQRTLQSRPLFPIPSAVGAIAYRFNEETGTYERIKGSFGPLLAERGTTSGEGNVNISFAYTFAEFEKLNGSDIINLTLHHCLEPRCTFGNPDAAFLKDVIRVEMRMRLKSQVLSTSVVYGLTNSLDLGIVIPYIRNDLTVSTHAFVIVAPGSTPLAHVFEPTVETPDQLGATHAIGIGDIVARGKYGIPKLPFDVAILGDITFPSGDKENFFGTGDLRVKGTVIASKTGKRFTPHLNAGYELNTADTKLSTVDYRLGFEAAVRPRLTLAADLIGLLRSTIPSEFEARALEGQRLVARSEIDAAFGGKWEINERTLFTFNLLLPLNDPGIRPNESITFGVQYGL